MDKDTILKLKVNELRTKLSELKLPINGRKTTLQDRLLEHYEIDIVETEDEEDTNETIMPNREIEQTSEDLNEYEEDEIENDKVVIGRNTRTIENMFTLRDICESMSYFDGNNQPNIEQWLQEFEENAIVVNWSDLQKFIYAKQLIKGAAKIFLRGQTDINSWQKLKKTLLHEFGEQVTAIDIHKKLRNRRKKYNETYLEYLYSLIEIGSKINIDEKSIIEYFVDGINDSALNKSILYDANNINELKNKIKSYTKIKKTDYVQNRDKNTKTEIPKKCSKCPHLNNHTTEQCKKLNNLCFNCGKEGHKANECRNTKTTDNQKQSKKSNSNPPNNNRSSENNEVSNITVHNSKMTNVQIPCWDIPVKINIDLEINRQQTKLFLDTGSDVSLMTKSDFQKLKDVVFFPEPIKVYGVGLGSLNTLGYIISQIKVDNTIFNWKFHIAKDEDIMSQSIIGNSVLNVLDMILTKNGVKIFITKETDQKDNILFQNMLGIEEKEYNKNFYAGCVFQSICNNRLIDETNDLNIDHLDEQTACKILDLVKNYTTEKIKSPNIEMKIVLTDDIPIRQKTRRLAIEDQQIVEKYINDWLQKGIIKPSTSEYACPIVLAKKKDGTKRLCCDFRKLNAKVIKDNFPMVLIDDTLAKLQNSKFFTTLDLKNGFFHVPIESNSTKYTSFVTHRGQYEFLKAPFGLTNSPAVFCRYITAILNELIINGTIIVYMDDIVIPAQTIEDNLQKLTNVLKITSEYGLEINWKKCQFIKKEITYLGYIVKNSSIRPSKEKVKAIENFPKPTNIKSLQKFLGLTSYFRRFIQNYATIAKPLTDLLSKNNNFKFTQLEDIAFQQLKSALSESPVLQIFNPQALTEVHTDASMYGYGAVLMQKNMETLQWHPVEYMSRKTAPYEQKYHSYDLEILAIISALKKWRTYLLGIPFKIITDCVAFTQTLKKQEVPARITRWVIYLQDFNFEIEHRSGSKLKHVDALSRVHCLMLSSSLKHRLMQAQDQDVWTKNLKEIVQKEKHSDFYVKNNILFKDYEKELLVVPQGIENEIIETAHKEGHISVKKTIDLLQKNFFIQNVTEKASKIVKNCVKCIIADAKAGKKEGLLNPIEKSNKPLDTYHIDHVGPLDKTAKQYNYILTIVDAFSKFVWLYPTKSTGSNEVVEILRKQSSVFGNPYRIITDRGTAFTSQTFKEYCSEENIEHVLTTTGVPRGNGQVERMHKIVISLLTKLCVNSPTKWYKYLGKIQQTINNTRPRSTNTTPFQILTGIPMKINNIDIIKDLIETEIIDELNTYRDEIRQKAKENILKLQQENIKTFNKNRKVEHEYQIGDLVAIKRTQFGSQLKIKPKFLGPYKIIEKKGKGRYKVEKIDETEGPKTTMTTAEYMKTWHAAFGTNTSQNDRV